MKKIASIIATSILVTFSLPAAADYCDSRGERCWKNSADGTLASIQRALRTIDSMTSDQEWKQRVFDDQRRWEQQVNAQCQSWRCIELSARARSQLLFGVVSDLKKIANQKQ